MMKPSDSQQMAAIFAGSAIETDTTCQAFAQWLTEMKTRSSKTLQEMLSEMAIIRDSITSNNVELTDFKRHSTSISQEMQRQLTDLREKLTNAFGEITALVRQKTQSDQEMMQDINSLQQSIACKNAELEALKKSYSQAHQQLQSSLSQIQNHLFVTSGDVQTAKGTWERVQGDMAQRFSDADMGLKTLEDQLSVANAESRAQMLQLQEEIARIHESLASVSTDFLDHKRATNSSQNMLQSQVWGLEEGRKRQQQMDESALAGNARPQPRGGSYEPPLAAPAQQPLSQPGPPPPKTEPMAQLGKLQPAGMPVPAQQLQQPQGRPMLQPQSLGSQQMIQGYPGQMQQAPQTMFTPGISTRSPSPSMRGQPMMQQQGPPMAGAMRQPGRY